MKKANPLVTTFCARVRGYRHHAGLTLAQLAKKVGCSKGHISLFETSGGYNIHMKQAAKIFLALKMPFRKSMAELWARKAPAIIQDVFLDAVKRMK